MKSGTKQVLTSCVLPAPVTVPSANSDSQTTQVTVLSQPPTASQLYICVLSLFPMVRTPPESTQHLWGHSHSALVISLH